MRNDVGRDYYTVSEVADLLAVSPSTVWRWIEAEKLPAYRVGPRAIRVRKADVELVLRPARPRAATERTERATDAGTSEEQAGREDLWAGYDPEKVREMLAKTAGSWADLDTERLLANLYRARAEGSRPADRP